jgi:hypothetical protein
MDLQDRRIKIHREEMDSLLNLKSKLDHEEAASSYAAQYQQLGWALQVLNPQDGTDLDADAGADPETWVNRGEPGLPGPEINLGVRTGKRSRLMVLEVAKGPGEAILNQYGPWRAECIAVLGAGRERHFYAWDPSPRFDSPFVREAGAFRWYGEDQVILVPPSIEAEGLESWQWLSLPWETPPQSPGPAVADFLQHHLTRKPQLRPEVSMSWQEVYCLVSPFEPLLRALAASYTSMGDYYQGILTAAAEAGLNSPEALLSVLWHAPRRKSRQHPESLAYLQQLVAAASVHPPPAPCPENVPWKLSGDNGRSQAREYSAGSSGPAPHKPGPQPFFKRRQAHAPQPGGPIRSPFSCGKIRSD